MQIFIQNEGREIRGTNYFDLPMGKAGKFYLSINAGAFRLLVPPSKEAEISKAIQDMKKIEIEKGPLPSFPGIIGLIIWFDDGTESPFAVQLDTHSIDRLPLDTDHGKDVVFMVWFSRGTTCSKRFQFPNVKFMVKK
jgi:hypothetical protein